jgi:hypothetical protein
MKKLYPFLILLLFSCTKNQIDQEIIIPEPIEQIYSCVSYDNLLDPLNTEDNNLIQYWDKFVADVECSTGTDFKTPNTVLNIFFEYKSASQIAQGVSSDHIAYSTFDGYCNNSRVNVGVLYDEWYSKNLLQRLWIMYHEFGHDVYKYEHSTDPADIMYPSSTRGDITINDFIEAKDRMLKRKFPGIKYISCPSD